LTTKTTFTSTITRKLKIVIISIDLHINSGDCWDKLKRSKSLSVKKTSKFLKKMIETTLMRTHTLIKGAFKVLNI
jgi:hypothetical protein